MNNRRYNRRISGSQRKPTPKWVECYLLYVQPASGLMITSIRLPRTAFRFASLVRAYSTFNASRSSCKRDDYCGLGRFTDNHIGFYQKDLENL